VRSRAENGVVKGWKKRGQGRRTAWSREGKSVGKGGERSEKERGKARSRERESAVKGEEKARVKERNDNRNILCPSI
jgi:hypothetical protein